MERTNQGGLFSKFSSMDRNLLLSPVSQHFRDFPPTKTLLQLIRRRDWDGCKYRLLTYPWDAQYRDRSGNNSMPLHLVCLYRAPIEVVTMLVDAHPRALLAQDTEGWTPIHLILLYGGDEEIALLLIRRGGRMCQRDWTETVSFCLEQLCSQSTKCKYRSRIKTDWRIDRG